MEIFVVSLPPTRNKTLKKAYFHILCVLIVAAFASACKRDAKAPEVPTISIVSEAIPKDRKIPCVVVYLENGNAVMENGRVKRRGGMSCVFPKASYTVKLDHKMSLAGLPEQRSYIFNANYIDKSMMHHKICFDLFREMNPAKNLAARCAYVNLNLNDAYNGLYVLMQKLNAGSLGLDKDDSLAMIFKDPPVFHGENRLDPQYVQEPGNYFQQNYPDLEDRDMNGYLEDVMQFMIQADDSTFAHQIGRIFDLDNIVDWHLLLMFTNNGDGVMKNFYLYKRDSLTPFRIAIWDYDDAFGRDGEGELKMTESLPDFERCLLLRRLAHNPYLDYDTMLRRRYRQLRDNGLFSKRKIERMIEENDKIIKEEVARNFGRWPVDGIGYYDACTYEEELEVMRRYLDIRIPQLDEEMGYGRR